MARPLKTISEIATGKAAITPDTAIQLESFPRRCAVVAGVIEPVGSQAVLAPANRRADRALATQARRF